jgi:hypothetical protein
MTPQRIHVASEDSEDSGAVADWTGERQRDVGRSDVQLLGTSVLGTTELHHLSASLEVALKAELD